MTLIQRQAALVAQLESLYKTHFSMGHKAFSGKTIGTRSKLKRLHVEDMLKAGYSKQEAQASAEQCNDVAYLNADCHAFETQMGVAA